MSQSRRFHIVAALVGILVLVGGSLALAWTPLPVEDDPLLRMPGTQPGVVTKLEGPNRCTNCHSDYDQAIEPGSNWMGSMMAQSARDFLFWACMTVAGQDSVWALGNPNAVDLCERCHFPQGWLAGRSDPPNASAMSGVDYDGVQCDFCHSLYDPFFEGTHELAREGDLDGSGAIDPSEWRSYWDETNIRETPSQTAADATYTEDAILAQGITFFDGDPFYTNNLPPTAYTENGSGQYFASPDGDKRASFTDATGRHSMLYSRYHKSKYYCSSCHDVSNPALANLGQDGSAPLTSETQPAYSYYHIERTFSEFMLSDYGLEGGSAGLGPYAPEVFTTSHTSNVIATCQDCHMPDAVGKGADMSDAVVRPDESVEHPQSGQPVHDLTGGNMWVGYVLASAAPASPNYDPENEALLDQGPDVLTLDLGQGDGYDPGAILRGVDRARQQLLQAAAIEELTYDPGSGAISFRIQNYTGHKLISGFPEGRRMFVGIKAYSGGSLIYEVNPYDAGIGTLKGLPEAYSPNSPALATGEAHVEALVYEMHPSSSLTGEDETFHFVLADDRYKDNRIPPKGFRIDEAPARLAQPVWHGQEEDPNNPTIYTPEEYAGGYDAVDLADYGILVPGADLIEVTLYYQTTSREYIEFLRDEINGDSTRTLSSPTPSGEPEAYIIQSDPFFDQLKAWGDTIWQLWDRNKDLPGASPFAMTGATWSGTPPTPSVQLSPDAQAVTESAGTVAVTVTLSSPSLAEVSVPFTVGGSASGGGVDHDLAAGTFVLESGTLSDSLTFQVTDDALYERAETVVVTLGEPVNASLGSPSQQTITIVDDDDEPEISFSQPAYDQAESGGSATITVTLSGETALTASVNYATSDGSATAGADYTASSGSLSFSPGEVTKTFDVPVLVDTLPEDDETVNLSLAGAVSATLGTGTAQLTLIDDDPLPSLSVSDSSADEIDSHLTFTASLSAASGRDVSVDYTTSDGSATAGEDYSAATGETLTIPAGQTSGLIQIPLIDDALDEPNETFTLTLSNANYATLVSNQATGTIIDDDPLPSLSVSDSSASESDGHLTFTASLSAASGRDVSVDYTTSDDSATAGQDYSAATGETLTI
ncbi:MAG: Calx-beta domain-containing protein, partial [Anaerolineae bacterium]